MLICVFCFYLWPFHGYKYLLISVCDFFFSSWMSNKHLKFNMPETELNFLPKVCLSFSGPISVNGITVYPLRQAKTWKRFLHPLSLIFYIWCVSNSYRFCVHPKSVHFPSSPHYYLALLVFPYLTIFPRDYCSNVLTSCLPLLLPTLSL